LDKNTSLKIREVVAEIFNILVNTFEEEVEALQNLQVVLTELRIQLYQFLFNCNLIFFFKNKKRNGGEMRRKGTK
jgi:hypothetical protein